MADLPRRHQHGRARYGWDAIAAADLPADALTMPPGFVFGAATSAHQVEGSITSNNWTEWERGRRPDGGPRIADDQRCGEAVDHWRRFDEDLGLMQWLGLTGYRFSVEWSRIEPLPDYFEAEPLHRYRRWCVQLLDAGITPMVTQHHFTEPAWITERGGFESRSTVTAFVRFVEHVVGHLGDLVGFWITVNEPVGYAVQGWWHGEWPPGRTDPPAAARVLENLLLAHASAYSAIHRLAPAGRTPQVGLAHNIVAFRPSRRHHPLDRLAVRLLDTAYNRAALNALMTGELQLRLPGLRHVAVHPQLRGTQDYLGLNHYYPMTARFRPSLGAAPPAPPTFTVTSSLPSRPMTRSLQIDHD